MGTQRVVEGTVVGIVVVVVDEGRRRQGGTVEVLVVVGVVVVGVVVVVVVVVGVMFQGPIRIVGQVHLATPLLSMCPPSKLSIFYCLKFKADFQLNECIT